MRLFIVFQKLDNKHEYAISSSEVNLAIEIVQIQYSAPKI